MSCEKIKKKKRHLQSKEIKYMGNTNLQLIFIEDFNQIDWKKFCKSLKEKGKNILNIFFSPLQKRTISKG